jgi:hypothetical protein
MSGVVARLEVAYAAIASVVTRVVFSQPVDRVDLDTVRELLEGVLPGHRVAVELLAPWLVSVEVTAPDGILIYARNLFAT